MMDWPRILSILGGWGIGLFILMSLIPLASWLVENAPIFCSGQRGFPLSLSYKRAFSFLVLIGKKGTDLKEGLCCACLVMAFLSLPGFFLPDVILQAIPVNFLSDPLLIGMGLLLVRFYLMSDEALSVLANGAFVLLWLYLLLLLIAPHDYDFSMLARHANAPVNGVLTASLLALMLAVPLPLAPDLRCFPQNEAAFRHYSRRDIDHKYGLLIFFQAMWIMFMADLIVIPAKLGGWSAFSGSFFWRVCLVIAGCTVCRLTRLEKNPHYSALFLGLGLLFALSGRLGS